MTPCPKCGDMRIRRIEKDPRCRSGQTVRQVCLRCTQKRLRRLVTSTPLAGFRNRLQQARRRGKFVVTVDARYLLTLWEKQKGLCVLSGVKMTWRTGDTRLTSISIDRIDQEKGYEPGNVRLICFGLNNLRSHRSDKEALALARAYVKWQN